MNITFPADHQTPLSRKHWLMLLFIFGIAFALRLLATIMFEGLAEGPSQRGFGADAVEFNAIAANLAGHGEYTIEPHHPTSFRAPGFPFALAGIYALFGVNNFSAAHLFFCLIGAALTLVVFFLAREVTHLNTALIAAGLVAVYPNVLYYAIHFSSEPLFTLLLTLSLWLFLRGAKYHAPHFYAYSGLLLGLAALTRPLAFYFFPFYVVAALWLGRSRCKSTLSGLFLFMLLVALPIAPWTARNYLVHHRYLLIASNGGSTFWGSNNSVVLNDPHCRGGWVSTNYMPDEKAEVRKLTNEVDRDRLEWKFGETFLTQHSKDIPRLVWYKFRALWTPFCDTPNKKFNLIIGLSYGFMIPMMGWGFWLFLRSRRADSPEMIILLLPIIVTVLSCLAIYGSARFRSTIEPILMVFAAEAFMRVANTLSGLLPPVGSIKK